MGRRVKKYNIFVVHREIRFAEGGEEVGSRKINIYGCFPKRGELRQFADLREDLARKRALVFLKGGSIPQCTLERFHNC